MPECSWLPLLLKRGCGLYSYAERFIRSVGPTGIAVEVILSRATWETKENAILITPVMFAIVASVTAVLLIVTLVATSRGKGSALGSQSSLHASRSASKGKSAEKMRPAVRQGLDTKAVPKVTSTGTRSGGAKPANSKSLTDRKVQPVILLPTLVCTEAPAEFAARAVATPDPVTPVEFTATSPLPVIEEAVSSPPTDDNATQVCAVPAPVQEAVEMEQSAPTLAQEANIGQTIALPDHERSEAVEFASLPAGVDGRATFGSLPTPVCEAPETLEMSFSPATEGGDSGFQAFHAPEAAEYEVSQGLLVAEAVEESGAPSLLAFYGLNQQPFDVTPDPAYLYRSRVHREAFTALSQGIENLRGFVALVAEPGMGKTTLLNKLMEDLHDSARIVFLFQTQCSSSELLRYLLTELEVEHDGTDIVAMHRALSTFLFEEMLQGRRFVLIVDEAQNLQDSVLETIRLLSNYETTHSKLIQIVLAGQPQLVDTLMRPGLVQLRQRIAVLANLQPLDAAETAEYIEHRLRAAGSGDAPIFTPDAMALIAERSQGIPRSINNICFNAMLAGYLHRQLIIDSGIVKRVVSQLDLELLVRRPQQDPASIVPDVSAEPSELSQLVQLLCTTLASKTQQEVAEASLANDEPKTSLSLTGRLNEKLASQTWSDKSEFRIQVSLERDSFPGLPIADHYYCRSFYVSEEQAKSLEPGKAVRVRFEQD